MNEVEQKQELKDVEVVENEQEQNVGYEGTSYFEENYERTKSLGRLILLVVFTAIMLVSSTYAWFSTQKNVTLGGLEGKVNVAEGLQISLDALNWKNSIDLSNAGIASYFAQTNASLNTEYDLENPYDGRTNVIPDELLPVSTTAQSGDGIGLQRINMYGGENTDGIVLSNIELLDEVPESGYYAIDFFLQNTSAETATANDLLKLDANSELTLLSSDKTSTGLQNTVRVAFALFDNDGTDNIKVNKTPTQTQILAGTNNQNIIDVAIWEPNASGDNAHVEYVIQNNNRITWSIADASTYFNKTITTPEVIRFDGDDLIPTYAITGTSTSSTYTVGSGATATTVNGIDDIYNWASNLTTTGLTKQNTLKTTTDGVTELEQLVSVTDGTTEFSIAPGEYHKLRMYIWLEGQDVDCLNYASLGGGIYLNVGITKGTEASEQNTAWVPASTIYDADGTDEYALHIGDFVNYDAGTWTAAEIAAIQTGTTDSPVTANGSTTLPTSNFQFGGFTAGSSRNGNATAYSSSYNYIQDETGSAVTGWRVFDIDGNSVTLISAGNPEDYYHPYGTNYAYISEYILTGNVNSSWTDADTSAYQKRDWSDYVNTTQKAESATVLTKSGLDSWYSKYIVADADVWDDTAFQMIYADSHIRYQSIVDNYSYYWLSAANNTCNVYYFDPYGRGVYGGNFYAFGVRVLVSLSSDVLFSANRVDTTTLSGGNMTTYGGEQTYNYWNIK